MKKILGLAALALFVAGVAAAEGTPVPATTPTTDAKAKATETCQKKGLAGALLDECVKNELAKNTSVTTPAPATTGTPNANTTTQKTNP